MSTLRAGFVGFGEVNSPRELIEQKVAEAAKRLTDAGVELITTPAVSDDPDGVDVKRAIADLEKGKFPVLVLCLAGWIPTHAVMSIIREYSHLPMVLWGLTGYYNADGRLVTTADQAGTTAVRGVMDGMGLRFKYVYESIDMPPKTDKVVSFIRAANAHEALNHTKIGMMGYRDMNLYGTLYDGISLRGQLGVEIENFEMLEMTQIIDTLTEEEIEATIGRIRREWKFVKEPQPETLRTGAEWYLALKKKIENRGYKGISLIDVDGMKKLAKFPPSMVFMLLANDLDVTTVPENDAYGAVTQQIIQNLTGQIGAYLEFYEFMSDRVLIGVPDYVPAQVTDGPVTVDPNAFGDFSEGLLNVSKVKTGRAVLSRLTHKNGKYYMHILPGEAVTPPAWEEAGWAPPAPQLPSVAFKFDNVSVEEFADKVIAQHYILTYGDQTELLLDYCRIAGIEMW